MRRILTISKALADSSRLRILAALARHELCLCQMVALLGLAPSTISRHLAILSQAGLVDSRKSGRWVYYRLPQTKQSPHVRCVLRWVKSALDDDQQVQEDRKRLDRILRTDLMIICCQTRKARCGDRRC